MGNLCGCPLGQALDSLVIPECKESLGQIQKVIIQRINSPTGKNGLTLATTGTKLTLSSMETLLSATDGTKIVISPYINNPNNEPGAARTYGGGNQTPGGVQKVIGREATSFTAELHEEPQSVIKTLKKYQCENIGVYYIDENSAIAGLGGVSNKLMPIPVEGFFVGDKKFGGLEEIDSNAISWSHKPNWSDDLVIIKPSDMDFNALQDLVNPNA